MTPEEIAARLLVCQSRAEAEQVASGLKGRTLQAVADVLGIYLYGSAAKRRELLVLYVARGLQYDSIQRMGRG